jgi:hypothetical protein
MHYVSGAMSINEDLIQSLHSVFCDDWSFRYYGKSAIFVRDYGMGKETVRIKKHNDGFWTAKVKNLDRTKEIHTVGGINAHRLLYSNPKMLSIKEAEKIRLNFITETEHIGNNELHTVGNIEYGTTIEKELCNISVGTHPHYYLTDFVILKTRDVSSIVPFLLLRYEFFWV